MNAASWQWERWGLVLAGALTGLLASVSSAQAETLPVRGVLDARVRSADYNEQQIYRLPAFVGYQIDLQFEPGEHFVGVGAGDIEALSFSAQGNHLFLNPAWRQWQPTSPY